MIENSPFGVEKTIKGFIKNDTSEIFEYQKEVDSRQESIKTLESFQQLNLKAEFNDYCSKFSPDYFAISVANGDKNKSFLDNLSHNFPVEGRKIGRRTIGYAFELMCFAHLKTMEEFSRVSSPQKTKETLVEAYQLLDAEKTIVTLDEDLGLKNTVYDIRENGIKKPLLIADGLLLSTENGSVLFEYKSNLNRTNARYNWELPAQLKKQALAIKEYMQFMNAWNFKKAVYVIGNRGVNSIDHDSLAVEELTRIIGNVDVIYLPVTTARVSAITNAMLTEYSQQLFSNTPKTPGQIDNIQFTC